MNIEKLCNQYSVKFLNGKVNLNDFATNVIKSKNAKEYVKTLKRKKITTEKIENCLYISENDALEIIKCSKSQSCKDFIKAIEDNEKIENVNVVDADGGVFIFHGKNIFTTVDENNEIWFRGIDIVNILKCEHPIKVLNTIECEDKSLFENLEGVLTPENTESEDLHKNLQPNTIMINEIAVFNLIFQIKDNGAKIFKKWFSKDLLSSIRKIGKYKQKNKCAQLLMDLTDYENTYCVYLIETEKDTYKYGDTYNIKSRLKAHRTNFESTKCIKIFKFEDYRNMKTMAQKIKTFVKKSNLSFIDDKGRVEMFKTNKEYSINDILDEFNKLYEKYNIRKENIRENKSNNFTGKYLNNLQIEYFKTLKAVTENMKEIKKYTGEDIQIDVPETTPPVNISDDEISVGSDSEVKNDKAKPKRKMKICPECNENEIYQKSKQCDPCRRLKDRKIKDRPSVDQLKKELIKSSYVQVGKKYGVSDNCIRKWIKNSQ